MGIERQKLSARMTEANAEFIAQLCEAWSPIVEGVSATLNLCVTVLRGMHTAGTIDLSLAGIQRLLRGHCLPSGQTDSVAPEPRRAGVVAAKGLVEADRAFPSRSPKQSEGFTCRAVEAMKSAAPRPEMGCDSGTQKPSAEMPTGAIPASVAAHGQEPSGLTSRAAELVHVGQSGGGAATDSLSASAAETGRRDAVLGVRAKRPPRHIRRFNHRAESAREVLGRPCVTSFLPRMAAVC